MNTYEKMEAAFRIFSRYNHHEDIRAEHDVMYGGPNPADVTEQDMRTLEELGWLPSANLECFEKDC